MQKCEVSMEASAQLAFDRGQHDLEVAELETLFHEKQARYDAHVHRVLGTFGTGGTIRYLQWAIVHGEHPTAESSEEEKN